MPNETPTWDDTIDPPSWEDTSPIDSQFRRDELAKQTFQARLEGEQAKALTGLTDIGTEAAKAVVRAASHVDPTGFTQGLMQQYGVEPTHVIPPETFLPDVRTVSEVARKGVSGLGIDPNVILPEQYRKPAEEFVAETIASTPEMAPLLAAGTVDPRGVGRVFQAQMLQGVPQTAYAAATAPTAEERIKAGIQTGAGLAFPALIERGMRQPSVPIPDFIGRQLEMQRGAIPPRGEPVAPIERVTPEQAAVAAERMSAPFEGQVSPEPIVSPVAETVKPVKQPRIQVSDLSSQKATGGYSPLTGGVFLDKEAVKTMTPKERASVVRHELAHKIETESELWQQSDDFLWRLWEKDRNHPIWDFSGEVTGRVGMRNDVSPEIIAELYASHYPKGTFTVKERPVVYEWEGENWQGPKEYPIPPEIMSVLDQIESELGIWAKKKERSKKPLEQLPSSPAPEKTELSPKPEVVQTEVPPTPKPAETPVEAVGKGVPKEYGGGTIRVTHGGTGVMDREHPMWFTPDEYSAKWYADERGGDSPTLLNADVTINKPARNKDILDAAKSVSATPKDIGKAMGQPDYEKWQIDVPSDYAYVPKVVQELKRRGFDGIIEWDDLENTQILAIVPFEKSQIKEVSRSVGTRTPEGVVYTEPDQPITQGPGARTAQTIEAPESYSGTALKNAVAEVERAGWGMAEAPEHVRQSIPEAWIRAGRALERDPMAGQKLVDELQSDPKGRGLSVDESALLLRQKVILTNEMNAAAEGIHTAKTPLDKARAEANYDWAHEKMLTMLDAIKNRGTAWGQEGRWRQVMAREDFSLATLITQREAALGRKIKPGTPEFEELKKHADRLQELNAKLEQRVADVEKEFQDSEVRRALAEAQANASKELPYHPRILELAEGYAKKWDARGAKALAELKEMFGEGQAFSGAPISPAMLDRAIIYGTSKMVRGAVDLAKWTDTMVKDLGEGFRKYAKDVYDASKRAFDQDVKTDFKKPEVERRVRGVLKADIGTETTLKQIAAKAAKTKEGRLPNINYYLRKLGRVYAREGIKEEGPFLDRMTADVQKVLPQLTRDDVRAIFGGYAEEVRALSKEPVEVILRDMRGQSQELHKLSLLKQKIIPPKLQERATPSEKQRQLRKQVEAEKRTGGFAPPDPEVQLRSAMQSAETRLTNQITDLQREIDTGEKIVKQQRAPLRSEKLDALRERRDKLREIHDEVFKPPDLTDVERLEIWKERIKEQIDELRDRRKRGDFKPKPKPDPIRYDKEAIELQAAKDIEHRALMEMRMRDELSKRTTPEVIKDSIKNSAMFFHMAMAGGEFSAVFKQGATGAYSMPVRTARNFAKSLEAWWSEENQFKIKHEILTRDNAPFYRRDKLEFTDVGGRLSSMEEMYMFRVMDWMKKVPGLSHYVRYMDRFQRAFSTFLNLMRADTYDAMVREMGSSPEAGQSAANYINVATGRGSHSTARFGGSGANAIFFAPRWSISRFQYLLGQPILAAKPGYKKYIFKQYAKTLIGLGSVYALGYALGGDVDWNPTSSKFGKIQIGKRVIDPLFGLVPVMRLMSQIITGTRKNNRGKTRPIREGGKFDIFEKQIQGSRKLGPYEPSGGELIWKFIWSKFAPAPESFVSGAGGENVIGEKFSIPEKAVSLLSPITYRDIYKAIREEGIDEKTAIDLMAIFGLSSYVEKPRKSSTNF